MFAVVSPGRNCAEDLLFGTDYHSHLGTEFGGVAVMDNELVRRIHRITNSQFKTAFYPDMHLLNGYMGIGIISPKDEQPLIINPVNSKLGLFAICTFGFVENAKDLVVKLRCQGVELKCECDQEGQETINITKLAGALIGQGESIVEGIEWLFRNISGSLSVFILNSEGIYAVRSEYGHSPLFLGEREGAWAIALENTAFINLGFRLTKPLLPGEIIFLDKNGPKVKFAGSNQSQICAFFWVYTGFPTFEFAGRSGEGYREITGADHFRTDLESDLRFKVVAGIADSGTGYAVGYAAASVKFAQEQFRQVQSALQNEEISLAVFSKKVEDLLECLVVYRRPLVKYTPGWGRSYTPPNQGVRDLVARMKQLPIRDIIEDFPELVITEDSIVRGTQLKGYLRQLRHIVEEIWQTKMPRIHIRVGCPPLGWPCKYMLSTRTKAELAARRAVFALAGREIFDEEMQEYLNPLSRKYSQMVRWIAEDLGVASLRYQTLEGMIRAIGLPREQLCTYCWTGEGV